MNRNVILQHNYNHSFSIFYDTVTEYLISLILNSVNFWLYILLFYACNEQSCPSPMNSVKKYLPIYLLCLSPIPNPLIKRLWLQDLHTFYGFLFFNFRGNFGWERNEDNYASTNYFLVILTTIFGFYSKFKTFLNIGRISGFIVDLLFDD